MLPLSPLGPEPQLPAEPHECEVLVFWLENAGVEGHLGVFPFFPWRLRIWKQGVCGTRSSPSPSQGPWKPAGDEGRARPSVQPQTLNTLRPRIGSPVPRPICAGPGRTSPVGAELEVGVS